MQSQIHCSGFPLSLQGERGFKGEFGRAGDKGESGEPGSVGPWVLDTFITTVSTVMILILRLVLRLSYYDC